VSRWLSWALLLVAAVLAPAGVALAVAGETAGLDLPEGRGSELALELATALGSVPFAVVGLLIVRKAHRNRIGWIFLATGSLLALTSVSYGYADLALYGGRDWPGAAWTAWLAGWLVIVPAFEAPCVVAQLFPTGRPLRGRWPRRLRLSLVAAVYLVLPAMLAPGPLDSYPTVDNPTALPHWVGGALFDPVWALAIFGLLGISFASLVVRFRRARGVERQQLSWLALAAGVAIAGLVVGFAFDGISVPVRTAAYVTAVAGVMAIPVAAGVAILRYRLYEIDRIVSRTLTYAALTAILGAAYLGLVLAGQAVFSSFAGGSNLAIAVSTLVVAASFLPVRSRVQRVVDRRFNRRRFDAERTLEAFGSRLREQVELDALAADLRGVVGETMAPRHVSLWLRSERGRPVTIP
jgi:hypothetical protein